MANQMPASRTEQQEAEMLKENLEQNENFETQVKNKK
jgi:hypothetical protein